MLSLAAVRKFLGRRPLLDGVDLDLRPGQSLRISGPSGCGKTTLLRLVAGLERVDGGEISIGGSVVSSRDHHTPPHERGVAMQFQSLALWPHMRAWQHLDFVAGPSGAASLWPRRHDRRRTALEGLAEVGLEHRAEAFPSELSGGERQRLALARALAARKPLLLLDEPFRSVQPSLVSELSECVDVSCRQRGTTLILVTHEGDAAGLPLLESMTHMTLRNGRLSRVAQSRND